MAINIELFAKEQVEMEEEEEEFQYWDRITYCYKAFSLMYSVVCTVYSLNNDQVLWNEKMERRESKRVSRENSHE